MIQLKLIKRGKLKDVMITQKSNLVVVMSTWMYFVINCYAPLYFMITTIASSCCSFKNKPQQLVVEALSSIAFAPMQVTTITTTITSTSTTCSATVVPTTSKQRQRTLYNRKYNNHHWKSVVSSFVESGRRSSMYSTNTNTNEYSNNNDYVPAINMILAHNNELHTKLSTIRDNSSYFRYYSVDILGSCEYMSQELFECYTEKCEIYPEDDDEIPEKISTLDKKEGTDTFVLDGWSRWDMPTNDYYDIVSFPEGYTGYDGSDVWDFIHEQICFNEYKYDDHHWKADFNKAVSGLHSMISAQIIRGIRDKNEDSGSSISSSLTNDDDMKWNDPVVEYQRRLSISGETPLAMENLFFAYMLLLTAVEKAKPRYLQVCQSNSGLIDDVDAVRDMKSILSMSLFNEPSIQLAASKLQKHARDDDDGATTTTTKTNTQQHEHSELWQARMRCRDLLRIMNCVQCNKCRFHGKISVMGLITAFHIVLGNDGNGCDVNTLNRIELATLITTLHKFTTAVELSQEMIAITQQAEGKEQIQQQQQP